MPIPFKLDYVLEQEHAARRNAAQCAAYATRAAQPQTGTSTLRRLAKSLTEVYLTHQSWKAHDGVFMPVALEAEPVPAAARARQRSNHRRALRKLAGVQLSTAEANAAWPRVLEHKWLLSERLGRDVGLRVAAIDYFENVQPPRPRVATRVEWEPLPRLPMMLRFGERA